MLMFMRKIIKILERLEVMNTMMNCFLIEMYFQKGCIIKMERILILINHPLMTYPQLILVLSLLLLLGAQTLRFSRMGE
jgi:uncharacterized membrane protein